MMAIRGMVVRGLQQGRELGFPTINIAYDANALRDTMHGVYAARVQCARGEEFFGAAVVGGDFVVCDDPKFEVHLLDDTRAERYGEPVRVELVARVSDLEKISDTEKLREKIAADVAAVRELCSPES